MKTLEIITAILAGAAFLTLAGYLLVKFLGNCRNRAEENKRIYEREYQRPKK